MTTTNQLDIPGSSCMCLSGTTSHVIARAALASSTPGQRDLTEILSCTWYLVSDTSCDRSGAGFYRFSLRAKMGKVNVVWMLAERTVPYYIYLAVMTHVIHLVIIYCNVNSGKPEAPVPWTLSRYYNPWLALSLSLSAASLCWELATKLCLNLKINLDNRFALFRVSQVSTGTGRGNHTRNVGIQKYVQSERPTVASKRRINASASQLFELILVPTCSRSNCTQHTIFCG